MATIGTSTQADVLAPPGVPPFVRQSTTGYFFTLLRTAADTLTAYRSTDSGSNWSSYASFTHVGLQEWSSPVADAAGWVHVAYRVGTASLDTIHYRRLNTSNATWTSAVQTSSNDSNSGVIGSRWQGVDLAVVRNSDTSYAIAVAGAYGDGTSRHGMIVMGVSIARSVGPITLNNGLITSNRYFFTAGAAPGRSGLAMETEHNGDGFTSGTPNLWITWGRTSLRMVKLAWQGSTVGWKGPTGFITVRSTIGAIDHAAGRWDGTQWMMAIPSPDDTTKVRVYQRSRANTSTITYDSPAHPQGTVKNVAISYDNVTKNIRLYAVGTTAATLYYVDYVRASQIWTSWATVVATAVTTSTEWGVKRGGSAGTARHDVLTTAGAANPYTVTHTPQVVSTAPATPAFVTAGQAYVNGGPANVGATLPLAWTFSDADPGQTQGSFALSRQIGAGTINYWNDTTDTWGVTEVQNASAVQGVTLPSGWVGATDADLSHTYRVKVWDSTGVVAPGYSPALVLNPSTQVNPTVTAPTSGATLTTDTVTLTWTASQQTGARIVLSQTAPVARVVHDSGAMMGYTDTSYTVPVSMETGTSWSRTVYTYNNERLASAAQTAPFTVAYAPPPAVLPSSVAVPADGQNEVSTTALASVGTQPAITGIDVYQRPKTAAAVNTNSSFAGSASGYTGSGGTLAYSTAQSRSAPGSGLVTPGGATAIVVAISTPIDVSARIAAGAAYTASGWIRPTTANKPLRVQVGYYDAAGTLITTQGVTITSVVAAAWHFIEYTGDPSLVSGAARVAVGLGLASTPAAGDTFYVDDMTIREANSSTGVRIAAGTSVGTLVEDWRAVSGVDYEYRAVAVGANGTSIAGPWIG